MLTSTSKICKEFEVPMSVFLLWYVLLDSIYSNGHVIIASKGLQSVRLWTASTDLRTERLIDWLIDWLINRLIDWIEFYAISAIFQPCNCGGHKEIFIMPNLYWNESMICCLIQWTVESNRLIRQSWNTEDHS